MAKFLFNIKYKNDIFICDCVDINCYNIYGGIYTK
jgi:hypothetical protein